MLMLKKFVLVAVLVVVFLVSFVYGLVNASVPGEKAYLLVTENYTVQDNDTLDSITKHYIVKNTYGKREFKEFRDGIIELNYNIFKERNIRKGDNLVINYWIPNPNNTGVEHEKTN